MEVDLGVWMDAVVESVDRRLVMLRCSARTRGVWTRAVRTFLWWESKEGCELHGYISFMKEWVGVLSPGIK